MFYYFLLRLEFILSMKCFDDIDIKVKPQSLNKMLIKTLSFDFIYLILKSSLLQHIHMYLE